MRIKTYDNETFALLETKREAFFTLSGAARDYGSDHPFTRHMVDVLEDVNVHDFPVQSVAVFQGEEIDMLKGIVHRRITDDDPERYVEARAMESSLAETQLFVS